MNRGDEATWRSACAAVDAGGLYSSPSVPPRDGEGHRSPSLAGAVLSLSKGVRCLTTRFLSFPCPNGVEQNTLLRGIPTRPHHEWYGIMPQLSGCGVR